MGKLSVTALRRLCLHGIISTSDYWNAKKMKKNASLRPTYSRRPFNFNKFTNSESLLWFRFSKAEILSLLNHLRIPSICRLPNKTKFTGLEGLCIVLRRLCYPNRLSDLVPFFNRDPGNISRIFNWTIGKIYADHANLLQKLQQPYITTSKLQEFAECSSLAGCVYPNIVGYIDGTARNICRPKYNQEEVYSGYKKHHVLKYQSIVLPNGLIGRLDGPFIGRRHDAAIVHLSKVVREMNNFFKNPDGTWMAVYGDAGYSNQKYIKVGYKNHKRLNEKQKNFNATMSALRVSVEYGFGKVIQQFAFLDYAKNQKMHLQPLKKIYFVAAILSNCQTCLRERNQITDIFDCRPPTLQEYLSKDFNFQV